MAPRTPAYEYLKANAARVRLLADAARSPVARHTYVVAAGRYEGAAAEALRAQETEARATQFERDVKQG